MITKPSLILVFCCIFYCMNASAQTASVDKSLMQETVLEIPQADLVKILPLVKQNLKNFDQISFEGYCDSRKLLFLMAEPQSLQQVIFMLREMGLVCYLKRDVSLEKAKKICDSPEEIMTSLIIE